MDTDKKLLDKEQQVLRVARAYVEGQCKINALTKIVSEYQEMKWLCEEMERLS